MSNISNLKDLVGQDLSAFKIALMTEVYTTNVDGMRVKSLGFFRDETIAKAFVGTQRDTSYHQTAAALVLTDGEIGFVIGQDNPVTLFDDEAEALQIRQKALSKLSPEERKILGF